MWWLFAAVEVLDVQAEAGILGKGLEPFLEQLGIHFAEFWLGDSTRQTK